MFPQCLCLIKGCIHSAWFHNSAIVQHRLYRATSGQFCSSCPHVHRSTGHQLLGPVPPTAREQSRLGPLGTSLGHQPLGEGQVQAFYRESGLDTATGWLGRTIGVDQSPGQGRHRHWWGSWRQTIAQLKVSPELRLDGKGEQGSPQVMLVRDIKACWSVQGLDKQMQITSAK